jgi:protein-serine/threonine kinase
MSSALHPLPLQPTPASASQFGRQYPPTHPSPTRDGPGYHANQQPSGASPESSSSRRPSHRPSPNLDAYTDSNSPMSSRAAIASPVPVPVASPAESPDLHSPRRNMPAVVPPRTSSSRRTQPTERSTDSPRRTHADSSRDANGRRDSSDQSARSRRANPPSHDQYGTNGTRDARGNPSTATPTRSPLPNSHPNGPSREASEILNSILVSQPEVDIGREAERMAMAQPHQPASLQDDDAAAPPPVVGMSDAVDESRRGGRSRHDHSRREKQTKFGEYILGNTIGEGEFGKVKLGWKQEGGVQVRWFEAARLDPANPLLSRSRSSLSRRTSWAAIPRAWPRSCARWPS